MPRHRNREKRRFLPLSERVPAGPCLNRACNSIPLSCLGNSSAPGQSDVGSGDCRSKTSVLRNNPAVRLLRSIEATGTIHDGDIHSTGKTLDTLTSRNTSLAWRTPRPGVERRSQTSSAPAVGAADEDTTKTSRPLSSHLSVRCCSVSPQVEAS